MNRFYFVLTFVLIFVLRAQSQVTCKGRIENLPENAMRSIQFEYWSEDRWLESDSANLATDNSFHKKMSHEQVQTRLRVRGQSNRWIDFFVPASPSKDTLFDFGAIDFNSMNGNPAKLNGKENEAYFTLISDAKKYKSLKDNLANDSLKIKDPTSKVQLEELQITLNTHCKEAAIHNKGTFTGDILSKLLYVPSKSDYPDDKKVAALSQNEFERKHLLDKIPFGDKRILVHNGLIKAINNYSSKFGKTDSTELFLFIDRLMYRREKNEDVDAWLFHFLFNKFVNNRDDISLTYLLKFYLSDCAADEHGTNPNSLLASFKKCEVGKKAFDFGLPDTLGKLVHLSDIASKNKATILFFWRSDCPHCREFEPELATIYEKYKPLGLEVIGVSIDHDEFKWRIYLQMNRMNWINLHVPDFDQREVINNNYPIPGTPTLILVDKNAIVLNRMVNRHALDSYLEQILHK